MLHCDRTFLHLSYRPTFMWPVNEKSPLCFVGDDVRMRLGKFSVCIARGGVVFVPGDVCQEEPFIPDFHVLFNVGVLRLPSLPVKGSFWT